MNLQNFIYQLYSIADDTVELASRYSFTSIFQNPVNWRLSFNSNFYNTIYQLTRVFRVIAIQLVVLFFLIGFCSTAMDLKEQLTMENILKLFIKIGITQYFVMQSSAIMFDIYSFIISIINRIGLPDLKYITTDGLYVSNKIYEMSDIGRVVFLFIAFFYLVICAGVGMMIVYIAFMRMIKIGLAEIYSPLAFSTIASNSRHLSEILPTFLKYMFGLLIEGISLGVCFKLLNITHSAYALINITSIMPENAPFMYATAFVVQRAIHLIIFVMFMKVSIEVPKKALGLER